MSKHEYMVRSQLENAYEMLKDVDDKLRIWIVREQAPQAVNLKAVKPDDDEKVIEVSLTLKQRKEHSVFWDDALMVTNDEGEHCNIPFKAIYALVAPVKLAKFLGWQVHTYSEDEEGYNPDEPSFAFINLESEDHVFLFKGWE